MSRPTDWKTPKKRLNKNLHGDDPEFYKLPDSSDLAAQYLLLYEFSLPAGRDLNNLIDIGRSATRMTVALKSLSTAEKIELDDRAQGWFRQNAPDLATRATGVALVGAHSTRKNIEDMPTGAVVAMGIVSLLLFLVFRSLRLDPVGPIPNFIPAAMAPGLWGYAAGEVGNAAAVVTADRVRHRRRRHDPLHDRICIGQEERAIAVGIGPIPLSFGGQGAVGDNRRVRPGVPGLRPGEEDHGFGERRADFEYRAVLLRQIRK